MFENVTLEMSLKPFYKTDAESIRRVCAHVFSQWRGLLKNRKTVSVMLWVGDGSELLDYAGRLEDTFEWARFLGTANLPYLKEGEPKETSLHERKQDYISNAPVMTYGILKSIVAAFKEEGKRAFPDAVIRIGETFDIGPEFAISDFKYNRHPEICTGAGLDRHGFIDATMTLKGDTRRYSAYPCGIPDGTPFGTFLGKQSQCFLGDMGFDFLWLSNGLGFSADPWHRTGKIFDGTRYYPEKLIKTKEKVFGFWKLFRKECSFPLETRGTNNSVGIDYASDGVPLYDIYNADLDITAPPNSPWAALNDNFGLELMGHMTRICELPSEKLPFRYYIHDPWWVNSPWYDRYDGSPCDIYLPMAISRIDREGNTCSANSFNVLSIDNSYGAMPDSCVNEPLAHILKAEKDAPDEPAPFVWVYPMREYTTSSSGELLREMNLGDNFICDAINDGFPLCCTVSTDNFLMHGSKLYKKSVLVSPVPENAAVFEKLASFAKEGVGVIVYGTRERLFSFECPEGIVKVDVSEGGKAMRKAASAFGWHFDFVKKMETKPPTMALSRYDNALMLSVYNCNTTTDTHLRSPLGAPVLCGAEAQIKDGASVYRFQRGEHRECRVFVTQRDGVISCREAAPVNARYGRALKITGLEDASVVLFSEKGCEGAVSVAAGTDFTPEYDGRFTKVNDAVYGSCLKGEHVNGTIWFLMEK